MDEKTINGYINYIVDKSNVCSIVLSGMPIKYVTKYTVKCNESCIIELLLHLSVSRKRSANRESEICDQQTDVTYHIEDKGGKYALFVNDRPIDYSVLDYSIERNESCMMELDVHLSIPRSEMYLDIGSVSDF